MSPVGRYFKGDGRQVYAQMIERYGPVKGRSVFYATAAQRGLAPKKKVRRRRRG